MKPWKRCNDNLESWQASVIAGIFSCATSIFDIFWSISKLYREDHYFVFYILCFLFIESIIFFGISFLLFFSIAKKIRILMIPWIILAVIDIFTSVFHDLVELFLPNRNSAAPCSFAALSLFITLINCVLMTIAMISVISHYKQLNQSVNSY